MLIDEFDYHLPQEAIAQKPAMPRDRCKLLVLKDGIRHHLFYEIMDYLESGDVLVLNDTRVIHARIHARKETGGKVELLLLGAEGNLFKCLIKGKVREGTKIIFDKRASSGEKRSGEVEGVVVEKDGGKCTVEIPLSMEELEEMGEMPLPPYIKEKVDKETAEMYQSVFAKEKGSVAAPTAGLHFTEEMLAGMKRKGIEIVYITLHVGIGTFMPIRSRVVEEHKMEAEFYEVSEEAAGKINEASGKANIIAVGTTTIKTLESSSSGGVVKAGSGWSDLFIYPGYKFKSPITAILTNFHLPKSTPLLLVSAYAGKDAIMKAYDEALRNNYRFLSFGDAMLIMDKNV
ncbi:MAG: tRNA preQ1(34) S-adenosylmethionine ribosyltransferase-isomerase QueA [Thermoplasmata archaeon]|nr:MAG: tRNA preQ1(34) S-adenosylmethionine ribosyltransferase-isomerase QueA [Thermoplasmata archaeon]